MFSYKYDLQIHALSRAMAETVIQLLPSSKQRVRSRLQKRHNFSSTHLPRNSTTAPYSSTGSAGDRQTTSAHEDGNFQKGDIGTRLKCSEVMWKSGGE
jgi:hypothetical protein